MKKFVARGKTLDLANPQIMGIVNVTPDSFSGDGVLNPQKAIEQALAMADQGATLLDIGGESSRPGSDPVSPAEEMNRVVPVVEALAHRSYGSNRSNRTYVMSVDTYHVETATAVLEAGADAINDITGLADDRMAPLIAKYQAGVVIMHMQGEPKTMQENPQYGDVVADINNFFAERITKAKQAGIPDQSIMLDPGIGFGKTLDHNLIILKNLQILKNPFTTISGRGLTSSRYPILVGVSRKRFIGTLTQKEHPQDRLWGTAAAVAISVANGADIVRVHDVAAMKDVIAVAHALH